MVPTVSQLTGYRFSGMFYDWAKLNDLAKLLNLRPSEVLEYYRLLRLAPDSPSFPVVVDGRLINSNVFELTNEIRGYRYEDEVYVLLSWAQEVLLMAQAGYQRITCFIAKGVKATDRQPEWLALVPYESGDPWNNAFWVIKGLTTRFDSYDPDACIPGTLPNNQ